MTQNPYEAASAASISLVGISEIHDLLLSVSRERVMELTCSATFRRRSPNSSAARSGCARMLKPG